MRSTDNFNEVPKHIMTSLLESPVQFQQNWVRMQENLLSGFPTMQALNQSVQPNRVARSMQVLHEAS